MAGASPMRTTYRLHRGRSVQRYDVHLSADDEPISDVYDTTGYP